MAAAATVSVSRDAVATKAVLFGGFVGFFRQGGGPDCLICTFTFDEKNLNSSTIW